MSQLAEVLSAQKTLEESFIKKMNALEAQIQTAGPAKDTVAKVAEEFRAFRELVFGMLGLLRRQISECAQQIDEIETRSRRKALIVQGVAEAASEDCTKVTLDVLNSKLGLGLTASSLKVCHRLGQANTNHHRPILVKFASVEAKMKVWRAKTGLRGSKLALKEFLTKTRQSVFGKARQHFGMRSCWTLDGVIFIKAPDGSRHKVMSLDELGLLLGRYPRAQDTSTSADKRATEVLGGLKGTRKMSGSQSTKRKTWDEEKMAQAIKFVREKKMGYLKAAQHFQVPRTTLFRLCQKDEQSPEVAAAKKIN
ncbi:hypothetical protein HW555_008221 [Spodoptera exigua]|uniref:HTH psq-type domain-containing protein n=2 Tax=Spodoptera exigua TaxID=7107 RepID=A0A835L1Y9_SPOEX|nr:hypothetical protein HW555_008221 [Spodoptera exigua]